MNPAQTCAIAAIRLYQVVISPLQTGIFGPGAGCRYTPPCSEYAREAIATQGFIRGGALAARRLSRCHPWGDYGSDPVPPNPNLKPLPSELGAATTT